MRREVVGANQNYFGLKIGKTHRIGVMEGGVTGEGLQIRTLKEGGAILKDRPSPSANTMKRFRKKDLHVT